MSLCELFDDYVAHDLAAPECARFEAHLALCPACRRRVEGERFLDSLLTEATSGPVPADLSERVRCRLTAARRRRLAAGLATLAACALLCVLAGQWLVNRPPPTPAPDEKAQVNKTPAEPAPAVAQVHVTFGDPARVLAVPVASDSPRVTVFQVFTGLREPDNAEQTQDIPNPERSDP